MVFVVTPFTQSANVLQHKRRHNVFIFFSNPVLLHFLGLDQENHVIPFIKLPSFCIFGIIRILSTCCREKKNSVHVKTSKLNLVMVHCGRCS